MADTVQAEKREHDGDGATGAGRVRAILFDDLERAGMVRPRRMAVADFEAMRARLCRALAHMDETGLRGLATLVVRHAQGPDRDQWPKEVAIRSWGLQLQPAPPRQCDYAASVMASAMGRAARAHGYHVELYMLARRLGPPPGRYDLDRLRGQADGNRRKLERVRRQIADGAAVEDDRRWLDWYLRHEAECLAVMGGGQQGQDT